MNSSLCQFSRSSCFFEVESFAQAWKGFLQPWFDRASDYSPLCLPSVIVAPNTPTLIALKRHLMEADQSILGVHFHTPSTLLTILLKKQFGIEKIPRKEELLLLMKICAMQYNKETGCKEALSLSIEPEIFVNACSLLVGAGWREEWLASKHLREVARRFFSLIEKCGYLIPGEEDLSLSKDFRTPSSCLWGSALAYGFSSRHWNSFNLLCAVRSLSANFYACHFTYDTDHYIDRIWQGTWESLLGPAQRKNSLSAGENYPFSELSMSFACPDMTRLGSEDERKPSFWILKSLAEEVELIVYKVLSFLRKNKKAKIGIVLPSTLSPLGREVSICLEEKKVPHYDFVGHKKSKEVEERLCWAWILYQRDYSLDAFLLFAKSLMIASRLSYQAYCNIKSASDVAFESVMVMDMGVIKGCVSGGEDSCVNEFFDSWVLLPEVASFSGFVSEVTCVFERLNWSSGVKLINDKSEALSSRLKEEVTREIFISWLEQAVSSSEREKMSMSQEEFSSVSILTAEEAVTQEWTHLILCSLNSGEWEERRIARNVLSDEMLNELNLRATVTGDQGTGHQVVRSPHGMILTEAFEGSYLARVFSRLIALPKEGLLLSAHETGVSGGTEKVPVHAYFQQLFALSFGITLTESVEKELIRHCSTEIALLRKEKISNQKTYCSLDAYQKRRDKDVCFDEYSFCFRERPEGGLSFSCKEWEELLQRPEHVWFRSVLKCKKNQAYVEKDIKGLMIGTWVHDWIKLNGNSFRAKLSREAWESCIERSANLVLDRVSHSYGKVGKNVPEWWMSNWHRAKSIALRLVQKIVKSHVITEVVSELKLPDSGVLRISDSCNIPILGRIDLVGKGESLMWVLDFKTGSRRPLSVRGISRGEGLQLALYMQGLRVAGHVNLVASLVTPTGNLVPQVRFSDIEDLGEIWSSLGEIYKTGKVGSKCLSRSQYRYTGDFPFSTIGIEEEVLTQKWNLTHPGLEVLN